VNLEDLGLTSATLVAFQPFASRGLVPGRVSFRDRERCRLFTEGGEVSAHIAGALWHGAASPAELPVAGDWVAARQVGHGEALIEAVLPRRTRFSRRAAGRRETEQMIAANIDVVFLVAGLDGDFNVRRLERYLTLAWESGAEPVIVLNKTDLCDSVPRRVAAALAVARGAPVITASARTGAVSEITAWLAPGRTIALLGSSGAGKSTIVNALLGEERQQVGEVRQSDSRGRHTTTFRELVPLPGGGALIDTPGMRELQLWAGEENVDRTFDDIAALAQTCRFRNCRHSGESGCAVTEALAAGTLDSGRWASYRKLLAEARRHKQMEDARAGLEAKQRLKRIEKALRQHYRMKG